MSGILPHLPTVILVCMLSLSTSTLLRMTAIRATRMYVRLMSNTMDVPETHTHTHEQCLLGVGYVYKNSCILYIDL